MSEPNYTIHKAAGVLIKDRKLLVERSEGKEHFIAPGGSVEEGESVPEALVRELMEEFQVTVKESDISFMETFYAEAAGRPGEFLRMDVYMVAEWEGEPTPDNEVEEIAWVTSDNPNNLTIGSIFEHDVIPLLKERDLIN